MRSELFAQSARPLLMGILNVTPDSFSDGGEFLDHPQAVRHAAKMISEGADIIDVGGESTRPGASPVSVSEQIKRTQPVISAIREKYPSTPISIDTQSSEVAKSAIEAGASMVNDISALRTDPGMAELVSERKAYVVLMHMRGAPQTMQQAPHYDDVLREIEEFLKERIEFAVKSDINRDRIIIDPGIGFGKTVEHNLTILAGLQRFVQMAPVLLGTSRKSFIGKLLGVEDPKARLTGTIVTQTMGLLVGVSILRAHDAKEARQTIDLYEAVTRQTTT